MWIIDDLMEILRFKSLVMFMKCKCDAIGGVLNLQFPMDVDLVFLRTYELIGFFKVRAKSRVVRLRPRVTVGGLVIFTGRVVCGCTK